MKPEPEDVVNVCEAAVRPFREVMAAPPQVEVEIAPVELMTRHGLPVDAKFVIVRFVVVVLPTIVPPEEVSVKMFVPSTAKLKIPLPPL